MHRTTIMPSNETVCKICLLGDFAVGKTSLVRRFVYDEFEANYQTTIGVHITQKKVLLEPPLAIPVRMIIWDLMGGKPFLSVNKAYYRGASGALLVADLSRPHTANSLLECWASFSEVNPQAQGLVLLNKVDLVRSSEEAHQLAMDISKRLGLHTFLTSALTGENVERAFLSLAERISSVKHISSRPASP